MVTPLRRLLMSLNFHFLTQVIFYHPQCAASKSMQPFLKTASKILPKLDSKAPELWAINCKRDGMKDLCKSQVTHKYPYIVLYKRW